MECINVFVNVVNHLHDQARAMTLLSPSFTDLKIWFPEQITPNYYINRNLKLSVDIQRCLLVE